jgi:hypothetical protein
LSAFFRVERFHPALLALDLSGLDVGGGSVVVAHVGFHLEARSAKGRGGPVDLPPVGEVVAAVRDEPRPDAPAPTPPGGLQDLGGAVAFGGAVDERSGFVGVGDGEHVRGSPCVVVGNNGFRR